MKNTILIALVVLSLVIMIVIGYWFVIQILNAMISDFPWMWSM